MTDKKILQSWGKSNPWLFLKAYEGSGFNNTNIEKTTDGRKSQFRGPISKDFTCCALWKDKPPERWTNDEYVYGYNINGRAGYLVYSTSNRPVQWIRQATELGAVYTWTYAATVNKKTQTEFETQARARGSGTSATPEFISRAQTIIDTAFISWADVAKRMGVSATMIANLRNKGFLTEKH